MRDDPKGRHKKLADTWMLMADSVLRVLQSDEPPSASQLEVVRKWLDQNGVTLDSLIRWRGGLGFDPNMLPTFNDSEGDTAHDDTAAEPKQGDALRRIVPFAK
jgi:hypothetical protein